MEEMVARSGDENAEDPLALLKKAAVFALKRTAADPQCQRVFDVMTHKCEYLADMAGLSQRLSDLKCGCVSHAEKTIRNAVQRGLLPKATDARLAAVGLDAMIFGLISNWLADRAYVDLDRDAEALIDRYFACLKVEPASSRSLRKRVKAVGAREIKYNRTVSTTKRGA
jgi:TetR/AcrR family acrAB operon transcriptional repressor